MPEDRDQVGRGGVLNLIPCDDIAAVNGVPCRLWEGVTGGGVRVSAFLATVIIDPEDLDAFRAEFGPDVLTLVRPARAGEAPRGG